MKFFLKTKLALFFFFLLNFESLLIAENLKPNFLIETPSTSISVSTSSTSSKNKKVSVSSLEKKIKDQEQRISLLENAVRELQNKVYQLSFKPSYDHSYHYPKTIETEEEIVSWSCYLKDPFGKVFYGKGETEIEAGGIALKKCGGGLSCKKEKLKCSSEKQIKKKIIPIHKNTIIEKKTKKKVWSCLLQDTFNNTFTGKGETEAEARAKALQACGGGLSCKESRLKCSSNY